MIRPLAHLLIAVAALAATAAGAFEPSRRDLGDLIVLDVGGSYAEMGRQQARLLGDDLRRVYERQHGDYERAVARGGVGARLLDAVGIPLWAWVGGTFEDSHFHDEIAGLAAGLGASRSDVMRALLSLGGGSTVFAATRTATADGQALIGRNVDWDDARGLRRPLVVHVHPSNGDLEHFFVGWPLVGLPAVGINEAGFALSFNYFVTDPQVGVWLPQWPHRRVLQTARTVDEGIAIFLAARERGISSFMVMADATGDIAMVECTPSRCAVFRPDGDWFGQSNHARTPEMIPFDRYRSPDSFDRRAGIERAIEPRLGRLTPALAAEILRDRSTHPWPNASNVANLGVLNAAILQPASRTLWHSTTMQPSAPFGAYAAFAFGPGAAPAPIPASPLLGSDALRREEESIVRARDAVDALADRRFADAVAPLEQLLAEPQPRLDPTRLAVGLGYAKLELGDCAGADEALARALASDTPIDVRIHATSLRALCADRLGRRDEAAALCSETLALVESHPEWDVFDEVAALARDGVRANVAGREPAFDYYVLRVPL